MHLNTFRLPALFLRQPPALLATAAALFTCCVLVQDWLGARLRSSDYYFSESLLFSTCWWLLVPLLYLQFRIWKRRDFKGIVRWLVSGLFPLAVHLLLFPLLVFGVSALFYDHTYTIQRVLDCTLSSELYQLIFFYSLPLIVYQFQETVAAPIDSSSPVHLTVAPSPIYLKQLIVQRGGRKLLLPAEEITSILSSKPYLRIFSGGKSYLYAGTLKMMEQQLDPVCFVRVHKSALLNLSQVKSYLSRKNGDYDAAMSDGSVIRVSRLYADAFKSRLTGITRFSS